MVDFGEAIIDMDTHISMDNPNHNPGIHLANAKPVFTARTLA
jgi:hypothetical protein